MIQHGSSGVCFNVRHVKSLCSVVESLWGRLLITFVPHWTAVIYGIFFNFSFYKLPKYFSVIAENEVKDYWWLASVTICYFILLSNKLLIYKLIVWNNDRVSN